MAFSDIGFIVGVCVGLYHAIVTTESMTGKCSGAQLERGVIYVLYPIGYGWVFGAGLGLVDFYIDSKLRK